MVPPENDPLAKYRLRPLFGWLPRARLRGGSLTLYTPWTHRLFMALFALGVGGVFGYGGRRFVSDWSNPFELLGLLFGGVAAAVCLVLSAGICADRARIELSASKAAATFRVGFWPFVRRFDVPLKDADVRLDVAGPGMKVLGRKIAGECVLWLQLAGRELMLSHGSSSSRSLYRGLREYLGIEGMDSSQQVVETSSGSNVVVEKTPVAAYSSTFSSAAVKVKGPDLAMVAPGRGGRTFFTLFLLMGSACLLLFMWEAGWKGVVSGRVPWMIYVVGGVFILFGAGGLRGWLPWGTRITFDRRRREVRLPVGLLCQWDEITAVQLCAGAVSGEGSATVCFQLNLVLRSGRRANLMNQPAGEEVRKDGERLAEFLGVPLLDHA